MKIPRWVSALHALVVVLSVVVMLLPSMRGSPMREALGVAYMVTGTYTFFSLKRAGVLGMTLRQAASTAPASLSAAQVLENAAFVLGCVAVVLASLGP